MNKKNFSFEEAVEYLEKFIKDTRWIVSNSYAKKAVEKLNKAKKK